MFTFGLVVPFFSNESYLLEQLNSIVNQNFGDWVCVVVDDSGRATSAEATVKSINKSNIHFVKNEANLGLANCWNQGLEELVSRFNPEILSVIHADDLLEPNFLSATLKAHYDYPSAAAVHTSVKIVNRRNKPRISITDKVKVSIAPGKRSRTILTRGDVGLASLLRGNFIYCPTLSFKSNLISRPLFNPRWKMLVDLDVTSRLLLDGNTIVGISDRVYRYRRHSSSTTSLLNDSATIFVEEVRFYRDVVKECEAKFYSKSAKVGSRMTMVRLHILYRLLHKLLKLDIASAKRLVGVLRTIN